MLCILTQYVTYFLCEFRLLGILFNRAVQLYAAFDSLTDSLASVQIDQT
jgi:hypothetical protein